MSMYHLLTMPGLPPAMDSLNGIEPAMTMHRVKETRLSSRKISVARRPKTGSRSALRMGTPGKIRSSMLCEFSSARQMSQPFA